MLPCDGTYNQQKPLKRLRNVLSLRSYALSSATDRFPLAVQGFLVEALFNLTTAFAWVRSGLGTNVFHDDKGRARGLSLSVLQRDSK